jgi:hypothetical protein
MVNNVVPGLPLGSPVRTFSGRSANAQIFPLLSCGSQNSLG